MHREVNFFLLAHSSIHNLLRKNEWKKVDIIGECSQSQATQAVKSEGHVTLLIHHDKEHQSWDHSTSHAFAQCLHLSSVFTPDHQGSFPSLPPLWGSLCSSKVRPPCLDQEEKGGRGRPRGVGLELGFSRDFRREKCQRICKCWENCMGEQRRFLLCGEEMQMRKWTMFKLLTGS